MIDISQLLTDALIMAAGLKATFGLDENTGIILLDDPKDRIFFFFSICSLVRSGNCYFTQ